MERLAYRNRFVREIVQELENYSEADCEGKTPQVISGSDNLVILRVSYDEWIQLQSSVSTGSDICYPDISDSVRWILNRAVECPVDLCDLIANAILTCDAVKEALATVIATDPDIQDALRGFVINDPAINDHIADAARVSVITPSEQVQNLLKPETCGYGFIFNQVTILVDLLNTLSLDLLEALIVGTNPLERAEILLSALPGVGAVIPFDEVLAFANELVEDVKEEYENKYDEALEDELRCGLFCAMRDDCELSISDAMLFYSTLATETLPAEPLAALQATIQLFLAGVLPGDWIVYMMHLLILACIQAGQDVIGVDFAQLGIRIVAAGDEADNDWEVLCTECPPPEWCRSITGSDLESMFEPTGGLGPQAEWTGTGWGANDSVIPARITLEGNLGATYALTSMRIIFSGENAIGDTNDVTLYTEDFGAVLASETFVQNTFLAFVASLQVFEIDVVSSFAPTTVPITVQIDEIQITGTGTEPTFGTAC